MHKSMEIYGSPTKVATVQVSIEQSVYATNVSTDLNALNGGIQNERFGIWGGLTEFDRKIIRRKNKINLPKEKSA